MCDLTREAFRRMPRRAAGFAVAFLLAVGIASAEEWHEAYRNGLQALARGDPQRAVVSLKRAITLRPQPGRNIVTYGTNVEARYFPYLRLAEAYLALGQLENAREALQASAETGAEAAEERQPIEVRLQKAFDARRPPPTAAAAPAIPAPTTTLAASAPAETPAPTPTVAPPSPPIVSGKVAESAPPRPAAKAPSPAQATPQPPAAVAPPGSVSHSGAIEILAQPPGALAYLDDELLGRTDPQSGRLVKSGLGPGRHRVRVAAEGHDDLLREIELVEGSRVSVYATLTPAAKAPERGAGWLGFLAVAAALVGVVVWMVLRRPAVPPPLWSATPRPPQASPPAARATPSGNLSPGAHRDESGQEWFGDFRLLELLGRGGMASVFKAERGGELSALKRPLGSLLDDADFTQRFLREAEIGRTLNHPNIVRILGRGHVERVPYFNMELIQGQTLQGYLAGWGAAESRTAAAIVAQVAEALDFAHSKGVIHRDLKPSNIMLLLDGTAKVMDFGIARASRFEGLTVTGAFLGTPDYVAPEIVDGARAEPKSDLYSLGVVFYELLTGQRPFTGETAMAVLKKRTSEEAPPPSSVAAGVPAELDSLVGRLLAKAPEARPASAEELVLALRDWLHRAA